MSIQRRGKMVGNPHYTLTSEGYSKAINGALPDEIQEALKTTGIVVLENEETESMMFLVAEELKETESGVLKEEGDFPEYTVDPSLQPAFFPGGNTPNLLRFAPPPIPPLPKPNPQPPNPWPGTPWLPQNPGRWIWLSGNGSTPGFWRLIDRREQGQWDTSDPEGP